MTQRNHSSIETLEGRQLLSASPWGAQAKLIGQDLTAQQFPQLTGKGMSVAVIDSGIDYNHPSLGGGFGKKVVTGWDFASNDGDPMSSSYAHGTGVAGMIAATPYDYKGFHYQGIAPGVNLIALRETNTSGVDAALKWVIANKAKYNIVAVNFTDFGGGNKSIGNSVKASLNKLDAMSVYVTSPSGNGGSTNVGAHLADEMIVGSVNKGGGISGFTNRGPGLDFLAPGEKVTLPYYDVGSKKHIYVDVADGTSWSAPQIAGAAAIVRQVNPNFTNAQVTGILKDSAVKKYDGKTKRTYAQLNLYNAVRLAYQRAGKAAPPPITQSPSPTPTPTPAPTPTPTPTKPHKPVPPAGTTTSTPTKIGANTTIQAEDFDSGAEGAAYHDLDSANRGGNGYRAGTGVDVIGLSDQGSTRGVGFAKAGEWLKYGIDVQAAGTYNIEFRVAAQGAGGQFHLEVDGKDVTGKLNVTDTKNWGSYASVMKSGVKVAAGKHTLRLVFDRNTKAGYAGNFNLIRFVKTAAPTTTTTKPTTSKPAATPYKSFAVAAGGKLTIQAEDFDNGASGVAYKDVDGANQGGQYRKTGVDLEKSKDVNGGFDVAYLKKGEWLNYTVNVTKAGTFNLDARVAAAYAGGQFHIEIDGKNVTGTMSFTNTGGFQKWATVRKQGVKVAAGKHTVRIVIDNVAKGRAFAGNVNWIKFS